MKMIRQFVMRVRHEPAFAAIFVITLALGVGANTALFSALRGYFLAPLPYPNAGRLIVINQTPQGTQHISAATYEYMHRNASSISSGGLSREAGGILSIGNSPARKVRLDVVTASWFKTLGVKPFLGRTFGPDADNPDGPREVVLTYRFWQNAMQGDPNVVGKTLNINAAPHTIVGIMPRGFYFPSRGIQFWVPLTIHPADLSPDNIFNLNGWRFVARLRPGTNMSAATQELNALAQRQLKMAPSGDQAAAKRGHYHIATLPLRDSLMHSVGTRLLLIELGAGLLLLMTAAILANLVTVRVMARRHETALRITLGANRFELWRAALAETLPLGFIGGLLAVGLAWWGTWLIAEYGIGTTGTAFSITPDASVVFFSLALGCSVGIFAAVPAALGSGKKLLTRLSEGSRGDIGQRTRLAQRGLTIAQIALGVALMINAALLGLAFKNASSHAIGMNTQHLFIADLGFHGPHFNSQKSQLAFYRNFGDAMRKLPGVTHAGVASELPFAGGLDSYGGLKGIGGIAPHGVNSYIEFVDGHALRALEGTLIHGRLIDATDIREKAGVAVIDAALARKLFGTTDTVGREIKLDKTYKVIGVIGTLRWRAHPSGRQAGTMWLPYSVAPLDSSFYAGSDMDLAVRSNLPLATVKRELEGLLHKLAPDQAFSFVKSMHNLKSDAYHGDQALPILFGLFSLLALVLAGVGTYGTVAYLIRQRLSEFAVRQAVGATPGRIGILALAQGIVLATLGISLGIVAGFLLARALSSLVGSESSSTMLAYGAAALVMGLAALLATVVPANRARRADLLSLLRPQ